MNNKKVLVIGGCGRIGKSVAQDIISHTDAEVTITSRNSETQIEAPFKFLTLDLTNHEQLQDAIAPQDLVIHCAGPFHHRDGIVLETCIDLEVNYIDVSDHRSFYERVIQHQEKAISKGVTAILNTCLLYTSPSPRDLSTSRMPSSA